MSYVLLLPMLFQQLPILHIAKSIKVEEGRLSWYKPNDGFNSGELSCGGRFTNKQMHIAHRRWKSRGCGRKVLVCTDNTDKCVLTKVWDAGPYGIYKGKLRNAVKEGRWKNWPKPRSNPTPPKNWKWRAHVDLSYALWLKLGKPNALSRVRLYFMPKKPKTVASEKKDNQDYARSLRKAKSRKGKDHDPNSDLSQIQFYEGSG